MDSRCPECGRPVIESLGPDVRPGTDWQRRRESGIVSAWWRCATGPVLKWDRFGHDIRLTEHASNHRWFFAMHLPFIFMVGAAAIPIGIITAAGIDELRDEATMVLLMSSIFGSACVVGTISVTLFAAILIGGSQTLREKRNLFPGATQAACYLVAYLAGWAVLGTMSGITVVLLEQSGLLRAVAEPIRMRHDTLAFLMWFIPNTACGIYYLLLVARVTWAMRYANR